MTINFRTPPPNPSIVPKRSLPTTDRRFGNAILDRHLFCRHPTSNIVFKYNPLNNYHLNNNLLVYFFFFPSPRTKMESLKRLVKSTAHPYPKDSVTHMVFGNNMPGFPGSFKLDCGNEERFLELYASMAVSGTHEMHFLERRRNDGLTPFTFDLDFKAEHLPESNTLYDMSDVERVINSFISIASRVFRPESEPYSLNGYIMTKPPYIRSDNVWSHGVHIQFTTDKAWPHVDDFKRILREMDIEYIDKLSPTCNWFLLGSGKPTGGAYSIHKTFTAHISTTHTPSITWHPDRQMTQDDIISLSIRAPGKDIKRLDIRFTESNTRVTTQTNTRNHANTHTNTNAHTNTPIHHTYEDIALKLKCLKPFRSHEREQWLRVMWILSNTFNGSNEARDMFLEFSRRSPKYNESECTAHWDQYTPGQYPYTYNTLLHMVNEDTVHKAHLSNRRLLAPTQTPFNCPYPRCTKTFKTHTQAHKHFTCHIFFHNKHGPEHIVDTMISPEYTSVCTTCRNARHLNPK